MEYIEPNTPQCKSCVKDKVTCNGQYPCHRCDKLGIGDNCSLKEEKKGSSDSETQATPVPQTQVTTYYQLEDNVPEDKKPDYSVHHKILEDAIDFSVFRSRILENTTTPQTPRRTTPGPTPPPTSTDEQNDEEIPSLSFNELGSESQNSYVKHLESENKKLISKVSKLEQENLELKRFQFKNIPNLLNSSYGVILTGAYGRISAFNEALGEKLGYSRHFLREYKPGLHWVDITTEQDREPSFIKMTEALKLRKDFYVVEEMTLMNHANPKITAKVKAKYYLNYLTGDPFPFSSMCFLEFK